MNLFFSLFSGRLPHGSILLFLFGTAVPVCCSNFVELPQVPDSCAGSMVWLLSSNDGFGHNYGTDEDNLRTFGLNAGALLKNRFLLNVDFTSFTDRNSAPNIIEDETSAVIMLPPEKNQSQRIDELRLLGGYRWFHRNGQVFVSSIYSGAGFILYDNLGTRAIQEGAHGINNEHTRPVPKTYNKPSGHAAGYSYGELFIPEWYVNLHGFAMMTHDVDYSIDVSGSWWVVKPMLQSSFSLSYRWNNVENAGSAAHNCYEREDGTWLSNKTLIGPLMVERGFNLENLNQYSYAGFRWGELRNRGYHTSPFGFTYSIGWPIGHNSWIEFFRWYPFSALERLGIFLRTYHTENPVENNLTQIDDDRLIRRTKETSAGAEIALFDPADHMLLDGFLFGGVGFTRDMKTTYDLYEARFLDKKTSGMVHIGAGLRLLIPDVIFGVEGRYVGAEIRANVRHNFKSTGIFSNPDLLLDWGLVFTER